MYVSCVVKLENNKSTAILCRTNPSTNGLRTALMRFPAQGSLIFYFLVVKLELVEVLRDDKITAVYML